MPSNLGSIARPALALGTGCLLAVMVGCGRGDPPRATIEGSVTFRGEPVDWGDIVFESTDKTWKGKYSQGEIQGGKFSIEKYGPVVGENRVEIHGYKRTGEGSYDFSEGLDQEPVLVEGKTPFIPAKYNYGSQITFEIQPGHNSGATFDLE